ncbi:MAG: hypothetical protein WAM91_01515 [Candidatus Acidiferrales bacterium]
MLGPLDYVLWLITALLQIAVVVCAIRAKSFFKFFPLNFYMLAASLFTAARYIMLQRYGFRSAQYFYIYFYSDFLLTICLFFALMALFAHVFSELGAKPYIRVGSLVVLSLTCAVSYLMVRQSQDLLVSRFVAELSQNLYFVGAILTYVLWAALRQLRETRTRLIQLSLALGVNFSALAAHYALAVLYAAMYPNSAAWRIVPAVTGLWLPLAWGYTFLRVSETARMSPARVVAGQRAVAGSR